MADVARPLGRVTSGSRLHFVAPVHFRLNRAYIECVVEILGQRITTRNVTLHLDARQSAAYVNEAVRGKRKIGNPNLSALGSHCR